MPDSELDQYTEDALRAVDLDDQDQVKMKNLSGGMRRRAKVAGAIVHKPPVLLLDEPFAGLDPEQRVRLREILGRLGGTTAILLSTHLLQDVTLLAESVFVLVDGRVAYSGTPDSLARQASDARPADMSELESGYVDGLAEQTAAQLAERFGFGGTVESPSVRTAVSAYVRIRACGLTDVPS